MYLTMHCWFLIYCRIRFAKMLKKFLHLYSMIKTGLWFSCNVFGLGIRIILIWQSELGSVSDSSIFWKSLCKIGVFLLWVYQWNHLGLKFCCSCCWVFSLKKSFLGQDISVLLVFSKNQLYSFFDFSLLPYTMLCNTILHYTILYYIYYIIQWYTIQ